MLEDGAPVDYAIVDVTTGAGIQMTTMTDQDGEYELYGVSGETVVRVTKSGYDTTTRTDIVTDHMENLRRPAAAPCAARRGIRELHADADGGR